MSIHIVFNEICTTCGGIVGAEDEECYSHEHPCRCDWWEDFDTPKPNAQASPQITNKKKK